MTVRMLLEVGLKLLASLAVLYGIPESKIESFRGGSTMRDRSDGDALQITQNLLAEMLRVQRPTITNAARELQRAGLIARGRRQVTIVDRQGLVAESCECYRLVRTRIASHLPKTYA